MWNHLTHFIPPQQAWPADRGTLLRPLTQVERAAAPAIQAGPVKFGKENEARSLLGSEHYSGAVIDNLVPKPTRWAKELTSSDNWAFVPPDVLNGLMNGDSNNRARQRFLRRTTTTADTLFACFLCRNYSDCIFVVTDSNRVGLLHHEHLQLGGRARESTGGQTPSPPPHVHGVF